ncbi:calcium-transporting ATPase 9, plasma membrane-type-like [Lactuca sativa]|uniref:calcium-transporting ATPase 9, plasma membrane-type-like n=1 Tax=Lactuca sativa TaxID=4236 RepID=UPI001C69082B|nr:calcium-transporting ATPase 9, plasma membrane-type-like [Lactuca sativa]
MTGESHTVDLMAGCKVADGCSTMMAYICGNKNDPPNDTSALHPKIVSLLVESVAHNTTDSVFSPEGGRDVEVSGSPTEKAILQWGVKLGMNFDVVRSECSVIYASPFNSEKKRGVVAVKRIIVWKQSLYLLLSENSLCFMYVVIWIRKICFSSLTHVNKITIKCDLF